MNNLIIIVLSFLYSVNLQSGLDAFEEEDFHLLHGKNIALVINHTSINSQGIHILELLSNYGNINIKSIFTPEHGLKGNFSAGEKVSNIFDKDLGITIISLYGEQREPQLNDLDMLDYIIFDIQDIGSRYYTYISTLTYILNAASKANIPVILLDRPNPLGRKVSGPIISSDFYSFTGMHPIPIRHGMTIGELALMINNENWLQSKKKVKLIIYKIENWDTMPGYFSLPPSPNIPNFESALIYNGMCLLEGTNLSEGRGTRSPFLLFGAPWMNSNKILKELNNKNLKGVRFYQKTFKPISITGVAKYPKYQDRLCHGIQVSVIDENKINPLEVAFSVLKIVYKNHPEHFSFNNNNFISKLYGSNDIKNNIINKDSISILLNDWNKDSSNFELSRKPYLLY